MQSEQIEQILKENGLTETELIFKENIRKLRHQSGRTLVETASALGIKYGKYRLLESYTPLNVKFDTLELIANFYHIPVYELFKL